MTECAPEILRNDGTFYKMYTKNEKNHNLDIPDSTQDMEDSRGTPWHDTRHRDTCLKMPQDIVGCQKTP